MEAKKCIIWLSVFGMLAGCGTGAQSSASASDVSSASSGIYTPGTYSASAKGMGNVTAEITVDENSITDVKLDLSEETENIGQAAGDTLKQEILDAQSGDIDSVSGATITSEAVSQAVNSALKQARGESASAAMTPGTYTATRRGSRSDITVQVTVDDSSIKEVKVTEADDSPYVSDAAIEKVPQQIVEAQSLNVDGVTGATITSHAITSAVGDALEQAGADLSAFQKTVSSEKTAEEDKNTDVLVVGGGTSGLVAALGAKTDDTLTAENDLNVMVVESNGFGGGTLALCGGYVASYFGTSLNEKTMQSWDPEDLAQAMYDSFPNSQQYTSVSLLTNIISRNADVLNGLMDRGLHLTADDAYVQTSSTLKNSDGTPADYTSSSVRISPDSDERSGDNGYDINGGGGYLAETLTQLVQDAGVDIEFETTAEKLLTDDDGNVTGVAVETPHSTYNIYAKKVILTTGFYNLAQYAEEHPEYQTLIGEQASSDRSFAQDQVIALGGSVLDQAASGVSAIIPGYAGVLAHYGEEGTLYRNMNSVWVNENGVRFMNEYTDGSRGGDVGKLLMAQPDGKAYMIFDSTHDGVKFYDYLSKQGIAWKSDTLEGLAEEIGVPKDAFVGTITQYNTDAEADGDTSEFATPKEDMVPVTEGPYYAVQVNAICTAGVEESVYVNDSMQVLLGEGGDPIGNLYAAGGAGASSYLPMTKLGLGSHVDGAFLSGAYAGEQARDAILNN